MEAFLKNNGEELQEFALEITREEIFTEAGAEDGHHFIPLDAVGKEF